MCPRGMSAEPSAAGGQCCKRDSVRVLLSAGARAASRRSQIALMCQSRPICGHRVQRLKRDSVRVLPTAGAWAVSAEADDFSEHPGGIQWCWPPGLGEKSPPILPGKQRATSGGYPRGAPLGSLLHPFLERKGWRAVPATRSRCGVIRDKVVGNANSVSDKTVGATC